MNPIYRISVPWYKWDSSADVTSAFATSNNPRAISVETRLNGTITNTNLNISQQNSNGIYEYVNGGSLLDTTQLYAGKQKIGYNIKSGPAKKYNPLTYGKKFLPSDLPNLFWWFAGEDLFNEFQTTDQPTSRWVNRVRTQNDLLQNGSTSIRPTISIQWNGFPCLVFDGVDDVMTCQFNTTSNQDYTWYFFIRFNDLQGNVTRYLLDNGTTTNTPSFRCEANNASYPTAIRSYPNAVDLYVPRGQYVPPFLWFHSHKNAGGLHEAYGAYPYTSVQFATPSTTNIGGTVTFRLGSQNTGANFFKGEIYEIVVFQQTHSVGYEVELMKYYFAQKYNMDAFWI